MAGKRTKAKAPAKRKAKATKTQKAAEAKKPGRPTDFDPSMCATVEKLTRICGATDHDIAEFLGVSDRTLNRWKLEHPEFCQSLKDGKTAADNRVKNALYHKAVGYSYDAVKIMQHNGAPVIVPYVEHVPPSDVACIFWLKNRDKENWRDKVEHEHGVADIAAVMESARGRLAEFRKQQQAAAKERLAAQKPEVDTKPKA